MPWACFVLEMHSSVVLRCVLSATRFWLFSSLADVPESSDPEFRCRCRRMIDPCSVIVQVPSEPARNLELAPSHYTPTQLLPTLQWIRVFHNSNGVFRNSRSPRCLSWMEIENNLHITQPFVHFPVTPCSFKICSECVHPSKN